MSKKKKKCVYCLEVKVLYSYRTNICEDCKHELDKEDAAFDAFQAKWETGVDLAKKPDRTVYIDESTAYGNDCPSGRCE